MRRAQGWHKTGKVCKLDGISTPPARASPIRDTVWYCVPKRGDGWESLRRLKQAHPLHRTAVPNGATCAHSDSYVRDEDCHWYTSTERTADFGRRQRRTLLPFEPHTLSTHKRRHQPPPTASRCHPCLAPPFRSRNRETQCARDLDAI